MEKKTFCHSYKQYGVVECFGVEEYTCIELMWHIHIYACCVCKSVAIDLTCVVSGC